MTNPEIRSRAGNLLQQRIKSSCILSLRMLAREAGSSLANSGDFAESASDFFNPLKKEHLRARKLAAKNNSTRKARVSGEGAARGGLAWRRLAAV